MNRIDRTEQKMQELFHSHAVQNEGTDYEFMHILQRYIFGDLCYTGSLDNRMRELVTITVLTALNTLPQLKAHVGASLKCRLYTNRNQRIYLSMCTFYWLSKNFECDKCHERSVR